MFHPLKEEEAYKKCRLYFQTEEEAWKKKSLERMHIQNNKIGGVMVGAYLLPAI